jgi:hypothetical protein
VTRFRLTARPAAIRLADALSVELRGEGATIVGGWGAATERRGWDVVSSGGDSMVLVVSAVDSAAVHRAISKVKTRVDGSHQVDVAQVDE